MRFAWPVPRAIKIGLAADGDCDAVFGVTMRPRAACVTPRTRFPIFNRQKLNIRRFGSRAGIESLRRRQIPSAP